ncbi:MAG: hypothetical protein U0R51_08145 [Solirubrobacterales bacterium]
MGGGGRTAGAVQVLGDRLRGHLACDEQIEDLADHLRLGGLGLEGDPVLVAVALVALGHLLEAAPVAIGGAAAGPVTLLRGLPHPALGLTGELRALELVPELLHPDHQPAFGGVGIPATHRIVDSDTNLAEFALEQGSVETVAGEPGGLVDHHGVEAAALMVAGLGGQRRPAGTLRLGARLLVGELAGDLAAEVGDLALAGLALAREAQRRILLVSRRQASVEGEALRAHLEVISARRSAVKASSSS